MAREIGVVKFWRESKGWGYIKRGAKFDIFVHYTEVEGERGKRNLVSGEKVEFEERNTPNGCQACEVKRVPAP